MCFNQLHKGLIFKLNDKKLSTFLKLFARINNQKKALCLDFHNTQPVFMDQLIQLFREYNLSETLITDLQSKIKTLNLAKKARVLSPGQLQDNFYFVSDGIVRSWMVSGEDEWTRDFYQPGSFLISNESVLLNIPSVECFEACCQTRLFFIGKNDFEELFLLYPELVKFSRRVIGNSIKSATEHKEALSVINARERYLNFKSKYPYINDIVNRKHLASYLGITVEGLSRIERRLRDEEWSRKA